MIRPILFPILVLLIGAVGFGLSQVDNASTTTRTDGTARDVQVRFSRSAVVIECYCIKNFMKNSRPRPEWASGDVRVSALVNRDVDEPLNYRYAVTGGRIIGQGPNVIWDFNDGTAPGKYSITIVADNGVGTFSSAATESITVAETDCTCPCTCPSMAVVSHNSQVKRGGKLDFEGRISGGMAQNIQFHWKVENGVITWGQGTRSIEVTASSEKTSRLVTARLEVDLDVDCDCEKVDSQSVPIGPESITLTFPAAVAWLSLDKTTITLDCPKPSMPDDRRPTSKDPIINVETGATSNSLDDKLSYTYSVSGGNVLGSDGSVKWDLSGLSPGTYTITAFVDDGRKKSEGETRTVTVAQRECGGFVACSSVSLSTPQRVGMTNDFIVRATVSGGTVRDPQYVWEATGGEIIAGQGSKAVRVRASSMNSLEPGPLVKFTLELPTKFSFCNQSAEVHLWIPSP